MRDSSGGRWIQPQKNRKGTSSWVGAGGAGGAGQSQEEPGEKSRGVGSTGAGAVGWKCGAKAAQGREPALDTAPSSALARQGGSPDPTATTPPVSRELGSTPGESAPSICSPLLDQTGYPL